MLEKDPFSNEIQNDDVYPTCQTMILLEIYLLTLFFVLEKIEWQ